MSDETPVRFYFERLRSPQPEVTTEELDRALAGLRAEQSWLRALAGGAIAAAIGVTVWGGLAYASGLQLSLLPVPLAFFVASSVRRFGRGIEARFGYTGAGITLLAGVIGDGLAACAQRALIEGVDLPAILAGLDSGLAAEVLLQISTPVDLLAFALSALIGYRFSFRQLSRSDFGLPRTML